MGTEVTPIGQWLPTRETLLGGLGGGLADGWRGLLIGVGAPVAVSVGAVVLGHIVRCRYRTRLAERLRRCRAHIRVAPARPGAVRPPPH